MALNGWSCCRDCTYNCYLDFISLPVSLSTTALNNHLWKYTQACQITSCNNTKFSSQQIWFKKPQASAQDKQLCTVCMFRNSAKFSNKVTVEGFKQANCCLNNLRHQKLQWPFMGCETKDLFLGRKRKEKKSSEFPVIYI